MHADAQGDELSAALSLQQQGKLAEAEAAYRRLLITWPKHVGLLQQLGILCCQQARFGEGIALLQQALALEPEKVSVLCNLGEALTRAGDVAAARACFQKALQLEPHQASAHFNLANLLRQSGEDRQAQSHYQQAIQAFESELAGLGAAAEPRLSRIKSRLAMVHNNLGTLLAASKVCGPDFAQAETHYRQALALNPEFASALNNQAILQAGNGRLEIARQNLQKLAQSDPENPHLQLAQICLLPVIPASQREREAAVRRLEADLSRFQQCFKGRLALPELLRYNCLLPWSLSFYGLQDRALREAFAQLVAAAIEPAERPPALKRALPQLGFVVTRGHEGIFLKSMAALLRRLPERYGLTVACHSPAHPELARQLPGISLLEIADDLPMAAAQLAAARFDLLYHWEVGSDAQNYYLPFFQAAPLQISSWSWPVTTGMSAIQAYLSSDFLEPVQAELDYSEKLLRMPTLPYWQAPEPLPAPACREDFGVPADQHVYFCPHNLRKIQPEMDPLFFGILTADPLAVIVLLADQRGTLNQQLLQRLASTLPDLDGRIRLLPRQPLNHYLALLQAADVILDSLPFSSGPNTCYDAFAAGTPIVTLPGELQRGRYTLAACRQTGLTELVAQDPADYIAKAVEIASDPAERQRLSQRMLRQKGSLFENPQALEGFCAAIDSLLEKAPAL